MRVLIAEDHPLAAAAMCAVLEADGGFEVVGEARSGSQVLPRARERGAWGFVTKAGDPRTLPVALRAAADGDPFEVYGEVESRRRPSEDLGLSEREASLLATLARGLSNQEIGKELWITEQTVKFHLTNVYRKLGVENRTQATRIAYEHGLV